MTDDHPISVISGKSRAGRNKIYGVLFSADGRVFSGFLNVNSVLGIWFLDPQTSKTYTKRMHGIQLSAGQFARKQKAGKILKWFAAMASLSILSLSATQIFNVAWWISAPLVFLLISLYLLGLGGLDVSGADVFYVAFKGFPRAPKFPWNIKIRTTEINIEATKYSVQISMDEIAKVELWIDHSEGRIKGIEDSFIKIFLKKGGYIAVPGSSNGFRNLSCLSGITFNRFAIND